MIASDKPNILAEKLRAFLPASISMSRQHSILHCLLLF